MWTLHSKLPSSGPPDRSRRSSKDKPSDASQEIGVALSLLRAMGEAWTTADSAPQKATVTVVLSILRSDKGSGRIKLIVPERLCRCRRIIMSV